MYQCMHAYARLCSRPERVLSHNSDMWLCTCKHMHSTAIQWIIIDPVLADAEVCRCQFQMTIQQIVLQQHLAMVFECPEMQGVRLRYNALFGFMPLQWLNSCCNMTLMQLRNSWRNVCTHTVILQPRAKHQRNPRWLRKMRIYLFLSLPTILSDLVNTGGIAIMLALFCSYAISDNIRYRASGAFRRFQTAG